MTDTPFAASVALLRRGDVLLIQREREPFGGLWTLPGGRLEPGESAEDCAVREIQEELGLRVFALRAVTTLWIGAQRMHRLAVFATEGFEGEIVPDPAEVRAWRWVKPEQVYGLRTTIELSDVLESAMRLFDRR